jgi:DNA-binding transcriptional regulator YiaG
MNRHEECGGKLLTRTLRMYRDDLLGIPNVVLIDSVEEHRCKRCGKVDSITIPNLPDLLAAVAVARVKLPTKLTNTEIRFLRKVLGWPAKKLAERLDVREETVSRWESGKLTMGPSTEKLLRLDVGLRLAEKTIGVTFDPKEITAMQIQPVRASASPPVLGFRFGKIRVKDKKQEAWEEEEAAAA